MHLYLLRRVTAIGKDDNAASNDEENNVSRKSGNLPSFCKFHFIFYITIYVWLRKQKKKRKVKIQTCVWLKRKTVF